MYVPAPLELIWQKIMSFSFCNQERSGLGCQNENEHTRTGRAVGATGWGQGGGGSTLQTLPYHLTLSQPGGADYTHHLTTPPRRLLNLPTALRTPVSDFIEGKNGRKRGLSSSCLLWLVMVATEFEAHYRHANT